MKKFILFFALIFPLSGLAQTLVGTAKDKYGKLLYIETHKIESDQKGVNKRIRVEYARPGGEVFAKMESDFSKSDSAPDTTFEDLRFDSKTYFRKVGEMAEFSEFRKGEKVSIEKIPFHEAMVVGQGFDNFIRLNFAKLAEEQLRFDFGVLEIKAFFSLTGYKAKSNSKDHVEFGIRPSNWLIRLFADELRVSYDPRSMRIKKYAGRSNILTDSGKSQNVVISYDWATSALEQSFSQTDTAK